MQQLLRFQTRFPRAARYAAGAAIAVPVAAVVQGALMLQEYRQFHGDAPQPVTPSSGIVVVQEQEQEQEQQISKKRPASAATTTGTVPQTKEKNDRSRNSINDESPLRLLVIGDSLAAGVGMSKQGTPILPESIARSLSLASGGRAVNWTCVGTPGASSSRIVQDIQNYHGNPITTSRLEKALVEWQTTRRRAQEWLQQRQQATAQWSEKDQENDKKRNIILRWRNRINREVKEFRRHVLEDKDAEVHQILKERRLLRRRESYVEPREFDIAVVLTGLNDLKDLYLPFMMLGEQNTSSPADQRHDADDSKQSNDGILVQFLRILDALQDRMKLNLPKSERDPLDTTSENQIKSSKHAKRRGPLVVFPALPASPIPIFQIAPLSWFILPLVHAMDQNKRILAQKFPSFVLFVESPSLETLKEIEDGHGPLFDSRKAEQVLLSISDVTQRAKDRVEQLMKQHYQRLTQDREDREQAKHHHHSADEPRVLYENSCHDHLHLAKEKKPGSTLIAADNVHPNDEGYDFWGRHIAAAIVQEWTREDLL